MSTQLLKFVFTGLFCSWFYFSSFSQRGAYDDGTRCYGVCERFSLSASPLALLDVYNGSAYKLGISYRPFMRIRTTIDAGGYLEGASRFIATFKEMKGYHFRSTLGYTDRYGELSYGLEYQYKEQSFNYSDSAEVIGSYIGNVSKFTHSLNAYASIHLSISNSMYIELRAGIGTRYREISNTHSEWLSKSPDWRDSWTQGRITDNKGFILNFSAAIRLNFILFSELN